jgi:hypothetical protein
MKATPLFDVSRAEIKLADYRVGSATAISDPLLLSRVQDYRRLTSSRMYPLDRDDIREKIPKADFLVSRKIDGEFTVLIYEGGQVFTLNPGGTVRTGLPMTEEAARLLSKAGIQKAMFAGELFVQTEGRRARVHDVSTVARQPQSENDLKRLHFAVFDILSLDGVPPHGFNETWKKIDSIFAKGERIRPVETKATTSLDEIEKCFENWVEKEGGEGIVVRSDAAGLFKIKPRHTLDVAVIGYTESVGERAGMLHDLLYAVMRKDGTFQVLSRVGGGFTEDDRRTMLADLKEMIVDSEYAEVNGDHVAYQMVRPDWVIEISCLDLISQSTRGAPINRVVLDFQNGEKPLYRVVRRLPLATVISPQFVRRREDKTANPHDIRIEQVSNIVEVPLWNREARQMTMPRSEILRRDVYTKVMKGETMVRKLLMWKTNKETESDEYPAYVLHFTDFSPSRKTPLSREVRVSSSREQMEKLWNDLIAENIAKGWNLHTPNPVPAAVSEVVTIAAAPVETIAEEVAKPKKRASKKAVEVVETPPVVDAPAPAELEAPTPKKRAPRKKTG